MANLIQQYIPKLELELLTFCLCCFAYIILSPRSMYIGALFSATLVDSTHPHPTPLNWPFTPPDPRCSSIGLKLVVAPLLHFSLSPLCQIQPYTKPFQRAKLTENSLPRGEVVLELFSGGGR